MAKKLIFSLSCAVGLINAMGFAPMGNVSTSLGGAGVALRNSAWGLYYNPALLSSDPRSKFSYSGGLWFSQSDLNELMELKLGSSNSQIADILQRSQKGRGTLQLQLGVVAQIQGPRYKTIQARRDEYGRLLATEAEKTLGSFGIGAFAYSEVIVKINSSEGKYYDFTQHTLSVMEVPFGYSYKLETLYGDFNFGLALKYMRAVYANLSDRNSVYGDLPIKLPSFGGQTSQNFGIDLGFLYSIYDFHLGLVAKNINVPSFTFDSVKSRISPFLRMGMSYEFLKNYAVVLDLDLMPNASFDTPKNQYIGFGIMGDYSFVDFRVGFGMDMLGKEGGKISAGVNIFGILDFVGELGTNFVQKRGSKTYTPTNFGFKIGSTFSF